jgi:hypothetical protein
MKNYIYILILGVFITYSGTAQKSSEQIHFDFNFLFDTISSIDPLLVKVDFENKGKNKLKAFSPHDVMKVSIRKSDEEKWIENFYFPKSFKIQIQEFEAGFKDHSFYRFYELNDSYSSPREPGNYILRITYQPFEKRNIHSELVVEKQFVIRKYHPNSERPAIDWMLENFECPTCILSCYRGGEGKTDEELLELSSQFIEMYPTSRYISFLYYYKATSLYRATTARNIKEIYDLFVQAKSTAYDPLLVWIIEEMYLSLGTFNEFKKKH